MKPLYNVRLNSRISKEQAKWIKEEAKRRKITRARFVRNMLESEMVNKYAKSLTTRKG